MAPEILNNIRRFRLKQKRSTIDVWWLYDDGGLSILLPHILTTRSKWAKSKLRLFCLAEDQDGQETKQTRSAGPEIDLIITSHFKTIFVVAV